jgi:hypothetical protein
MLLPKFVGRLPDNMIVLARIKMHMFDAFFPTGPDYRDAKTLGESGLVIDTSS